MSAVAIIPARGGSVRIPRKNIRHFHGKPIIAYSIAAAKASGLFEHVVVSTEDEEIAEVAHKYGADVLMRPRALADDSAIGTQEVTAHALRSIPCEHACCIYATAPMLLSGDLLNGPLVMRVAPNVRYYGVHGWYYWGRAKEFLERPALEGDGVDVTNGPSNRWIDIDTEDDWQRAERMYDALYPPTQLETARKLALALSGSAALAIQP